MALAGLALVAVFTRTGVGRDATRRSLEVAFARQFDGTLAIGDLRGTLFGTFDARDVLVRTADGDTLLAARRILARPTLFGLLSRSFEMRSLDLDAPVMRLRQDRDGRWNVVRFRQQRAGPKWDFGAPVVRVERGTLVVASDAPPPALIARGQVIDARNARYGGIDGQATVEWTQSRRLVALERLRLDVAPRGAAATRIDDLSGQFVQEDGVTTLSGLHLESGATDLRGSLRFVPDSARTPTVALRSTPTGATPAAHPAAPSAFAATGALTGTADADALRRLVPALPVGGTLRLAARADARRRADGTADAVVRGLTVASGSARVAVPGTLSLALTRDSVLVEVGVATVRLAAADVRRLVPGLAAAPAARIAALVGDGAALDLTALRVALDRTTGAAGASPVAPRFTLTVDGAATLPDADVRGRLVLARTLAGLAWDIGADVRRAELDRLAASLGRTPTGIGAARTLSPDGPTQVAGRIDATGTLAAPGRTGAALTDRLRLDGVVTLDRSTIAGRSVDSLQLDGSLGDGGRVAATFALAQRLDGRGMSRARGTLATTLGTAAPRIAVDARLDGFDIEALRSARPGATAGALRTRLSGTVRADLGASPASMRAGAGALLAALSGDVALRLDETTLRRGGGAAVLGPLTLDLRLAGRAGSEGAGADAIATDGADGDRLVVETGALSADLTGTLRAEGLAANAGFFATRLTALARAALRPRRDTVQFVDVPAGLPDTGPVRVSGRVRVRDASALAALLPVRALFGDGGGDVAGAPGDSSAATLLGGLGGDLDATVDARVDGGGLRLALDLASARLRVGVRRVDGLRVSATLSDRGDADPSLFARLHADSLALPRRIGATSVKADLIGPAGAVTFQADDQTVVAEGRIERASRKAGTPLRLVLRRLALARGDLRFSAPDGATLDLYADAVVVPRTVLDGEGAAPVGTGRTRQTLSVEGAVSALAGDTLAVRAVAVDLAKLVGKRPERAPIGGLLDADVALSALLGSPDLTGLVRVRGLVFGTFAAGDLTARAVVRRPVPGTASPETGDVTDSPADAAPIAGGPIGLDIVLAPAATASDAARAAASVVRASGTFRLPDATPGSPTRDGALDLAFDAQRLDASVLDALFPDVLRRTTGTIVGSGTVTGSLRRPNFGGELRMRGVRLSVPRFGLAYAAEGDGRLTGDGLALTRVRLTDATGGALDVTGGVAFNGYRFLSLDLRGQLRDALVLNVPSTNDLPLYGRHWASGEATLTGPLSGATLRAMETTVSARSEVSLPIRTTFTATDAGFIVFADSSGRLPDLRTLTARESVFRKPGGERTFVDGLDMEINLTAPAGSTINLVLDPLRGDVMRARSSGRLQIARRDGEFTVFGGLDVSGGDYLFTASDLFARRFRLDGGSIAWDGDPLNPALAIAASYRTRASLAGLPQGDALGLGLVPLIVRLDLGERLLTPSVALTLALDRDARSDLSAQVQGLEALFNEPERQAEYATSVLLTNSFLLTTTLTSGENVGGAGNRLAFASLSQLVGAQVNRYLSSVVPGLEFTLGLDGAQASDLDVSAGVALRLLDERLVIRGEGVFATESTAAQPQGLRGAFVVEVRLSPVVSVEVYYRREDDALERLTAAATSTTGASLSYRTQFTTWGALWRRLTGRR